MYMTDGKKMNSTILSIQILKIAAAKKRKLGLVTSVDKNEQTRKGSTVIIITTSIE